MNRRSFVKTMLALPAVGAVVAMGKQRWCAAPLKEPELLDSYLNRARAYYKGTQWVQDSNWAEKAYYDGGEVLFYHGTRLQEDQIRDGGKVLFLRSRT